jgi:hypothetical protein
MRRNAVALPASSQMENQAVQQRHILAPYTVALNFFGDDYYSV